jgi:hypothetical protein
MSEPERFNREGKPCTGAVFFRSAVSLFPVPRVKGREVVGIFVNRWCEEEKLTVEVRPHPKL